MVETAAHATTLSLAWLTVEGPDALALLDSLSTQHVAGIPAGSLGLALFLDNKARIQAATYAARLDEEGVALGTSPATRDTLEQHLRRYRLRAKCEIQQRELDTLVALGDEQPTAPDWRWFATDAWGREGWLGIGPEGTGSALARELGERADPRVTERSRIEAGIAGLGDLLVGRMPAEVGGMERAVSLTKGCYLGQEPVARLHYRGKSNRTLRKVELIDLERSAGVELPLPLLTPEGKDLGLLTSIAPDQDGAETRPALAMLRREVEAGQELALAGLPALARVV